jgi:hypothetical protein
MPHLRPCARRAGLVGVVLLALNAFGAHSHAQLQFSELTADAGEVRSGPVLSHRFAFVNSGAEPAEIIDLRTTCGCLTPQVPKRLYAPGEAGSLVLEVNTLTQPPGPHAWRVQVLYHSGTHEQEIPLQLNAQLITEVTVQPSALTISAEHAVSHELVLTDLRPKPLTVTAAKTTSPRLSAQMEEPSQDAQGHAVRRIHLAVGEDYPPGRYEEAMFLYTDDLAYRELKVPVTIVKRPKQAVSALPAQVDLAAAPGQPIPSRIVLIRGADDQGVQVERVTADDPAIHCQWVQGPNNAATVKVTIDRAQLRGTQLHSAVHVEVGKPAHETLTVPVTCSIQ